jgi:hypothetical protein
MTCSCHLRVLALLMAAITTNLAAESLTSDFQAQVGIDYWHLDLPSLSTQTTEKSVQNLFLANSSPKWDYQSSRPWAKISGYQQLTTHAYLKYKTRADQSNGLKLDDFHIDWSASPRSGIRAGVVDYKTSLCRTYEIDSPWVRENDPFCVSRTSNIATLASPGLQAYAQKIYNDYHLQAIVGAYRPTAFNYAPTEFSNVLLQTNQTVELNHRWGWSVSALNLINATELRLSWLGGTQETSRNDYGYRAQKNELWYLSGGFYPIKPIQIRGYLIRSKTNQQSYDDPFGKTQIIELGMLRQSKAVEVIYNISPSDTLGWASSRYNHDWTLTGMNGYEAYSNNQYLRFIQKSQSATWRHNFDRRIHSALQITSASNGELISNQRTQAKGRGIGIQIGYTY